MSFLSKVPGFNAKEKEEQEPKPDEQSLTTILATHEDRTNFLLLVAGCTESMRKSLSDTFEAASVDELLAQDSAPSPASKGSESDTLELKHEDETTSQPDDETRAKAAVADAEAAEKQAQTEADAKQKAKKEHERLVKEVGTKDMQELKKAALSNFDEWRDKILERVGEAVNQKDDTGAEKHKAKTQPITKKPHDKKAAARKPRDEADAALSSLYPLHETPFVALNEPKRVLILHSLLLLTLSLEHYSSQSRVLLLHLASSLRLPVDYLTQDESKVAQGLLEAAKAQMNADEETKKKAQENASGRKWKVGLGAVAGAALIGVTGKHSHNPSKSSTDPSPQAVSQPPSSQQVSAQ